MSYEILPAKPLGVSESDFLAGEGTIAGRGSGGGMSRDAAARLRIEKMELSKLNIATSLAYDACDDRHVDSGVYLERDVGPCYVCRECGVPIRMTAYRPGMIRLRGSAA